MRAGAKPRAANAHAVFDAGEMNRMSTSSPGVEERVDMLWALIDLIGGWREIRSRGGFSYQVSRGGKRRIVPIEDWHKKGLRDEGWVQSGQFADDKIVDAYGDFHVAEYHKSTRRRRLREHAPV